MEVSGPLRFFTAPSPSPSSVVDTKVKVRPVAVAVASLVLSVMWLAGIGSVFGIVLGFVDLRKVHGGSNLTRGSRPAIAGIIIGIIGLVPAGIMWSGVLANSAHNVILSDPSYLDGSTCASQRFSSTSRESSVCVAANVQSRSDNVSLWMQGCRDSWAIARSSLSNLNTPGAL